MIQYQSLLRRILDDGVRKENRTGTDAISVFGHQMRFNLAEGFPLMTTKQIHTRSVIFELLWMLNGDTNVGFLKDNGVRIWNEWADPNGELGPVYGAQWRGWKGRQSLQQQPNDTILVVTRIVDQIEEIVRSLREKPDDRRMILSSWNVGELSKMRLPPCHLLAQFNVTLGRVSCHMYIRSWDVFLGAPFNIAQYAFLTHMLAHTAALEVGDLVISSGDTHLYVNHIEQAREQLSRAPRRLPTLTIADRGQDIRSLEHGGRRHRLRVVDVAMDQAAALAATLDHPDCVPYQFEDFTITGYDPHPHIKAEVSI